MFSVVLNIVPIIGQEEDTLKMIGRFLKQMTISATLIVGIQSLATFLVTSIFNVDDPWWRCYKNFLVGNERISLLSYCSSNTKAGNTNGGSTTVQLTSCLTCLD